MSYASIAVIVLLAALVIGAWIAFRRERANEAEREAIEKKRAELWDQVEAKRREAGNIQTLVAEDVPPVPRTRKPKKSAPKAVPPKPKPRSHHAKSN